MEAEAERVELADSVELGKSEWVRPVPVPVPAPASGLTATLTDSAPVCARERAVMKAVAAGFLSWHLGLVGWWVGGLVAWLLGCLVALFGGLSAWLLGCLVGLVDCLIG